MACDPSINRDVLSAQPAGQAYLLLPGISLACIGKRNHIDRLLSMPIPLSRLGFVLHA
jgi:hypothetical protein